MSANQQTQGTQANLPNKQTQVVTAPAAAPGGLVDKSASKIVPAPIDAMKSEATIIGPRCHYVPIAGTNRVHKYENVDGNNWIDCGEFTLVKVPF